MAFDVAPTNPAFPASPLGVKVELQLAGAWTDVTSYTFTDTISIGRGHPDESTTAAPSSLALALNNSDGRFSSLNPLSPYWGSLGLNTPIRVSVPEGASYLRSEVDTASGVSTPSAAALQFAAGFQVIVDATLDSWLSNQTLASMWAQTSNQRSWIVTVSNGGYLTLTVSTAGTLASAVSVTSSVPIPASLLTAAAQRLSVRVAFSSGSNVTFYTGQQCGNWTQLGAVQAFAPAAAFASTAPVQIGYCSDVGADTINGFALSSFPGFNGKIHAVALVPGANAAITAAVGAPDFTQATAGATTVADTYGVNTWTLAGTAEISNRKYRFHGECGAWPQTWTVGDANARVALSAAGLLRRLGGTSVSARSSMYRAMVRMTGLSAPIAYWPCEDGSNATQIASGVGGSVMRFAIGTLPKMASDSSFACSAALPVLNGSVLVGDVTIAPYGGGGMSQAGPANILRALVHFPASGEPSGSLMSLYTTGLGTIGRAELFYTNAGGGQLTVNLYDQSGNAIETTGAVGFGVNGQLLRVSMELTAGVGGKVNMGIVTAPAAGGNGLTYSALTGVARNIGTATRVVVNGWGNSLVNTAIGHISVANAWDSIFDTGSGASNAVNAWQGEAAGVRFARLCAEEGIQFRAKGNLSDTVPMGAQTDKPVSALLQECADADRGMWYEPRQCLGYAYRTRVSLGNQTAAVTFDYSQDQLAGQLAPTQDDQQPKNDVTVSNVSGSSSRQVLTSGAMSVQSPPNGIGRYDTSVSLNLASDSQLDSQASWLLYEKTVNVPRYPEIACDLASTSPGLVALYYAVLDLDAGDRIAVINTPVFLPPGGVDQLAQGFSETLGNKQLYLKWAGIPTLPLNVAYSDDATYGRADTGGSTLDGQPNSTATTLTVSPNDGFAWTTAAADFPFDLGISGERITVVDANPLANFLTGASATIAGGLGTWVASTNCGAALNTANLLPGTTGSIALTSTAAGNLTAANSSNAGIGANGMACAPNDVIAVSAWVLAGSVSRSCQIGAEFYNTALAGIGSLSITAVSSSTSGYVKLSGTVTAPAGATYCRMKLLVNGAVAGGEVHYFALPFMQNTTNPQFLVGQNADFEGGIGTWVASGNCSVAAGAVARSGTGGLAVTSTAAGLLQFGHCASANILSQGLACSPGDSIVSTVWLNAAATARSVKAAVQFYTAAGVSIPGGVLGGVAITETVGTYLQATVTATAPANAAYCRALPQVLSVAAAGEVHNVDDVTLGNLTSQTFIVQRSVNGVVKTLPAGSDVRLFTPPIVSL